MAFAGEGAKLILVYKKVSRLFDANKTAKDGVDRYYAANAGGTAFVERRFKEMGTEYLSLEKDISDEDDVKEIYAEAMRRFGKINSAGGH